MPFDYNIEINKQTEISGMKGLNLKPRVDIKKHLYAEPRFMLPPDSDKLPIPFENLIKKNNNTKTSSQ